jgi:hypothetical protein
MKECRDLQAGFLALSRIVICYVGGRRQPEFDRFISRHHSFLKEDPREISTVIRRKLSAGWTAREFNEDVA